MNRFGERFAKGGNMTARMSTHRPVTLLSALMLTAALTAGPVAAQTRITPPPNKYSPAQDVQLGQEAAAQAKKELPLLNDERVDDYVERVGARLAAAIPPELRHAEFRYTFDVVNQKEINAFALPGGPMFLNRGMIEAAKSEAEMAGVMAHEMSHVALRHGTAQATKGEKFQIGAIAGQVLGAIVGGAAGSIISQGSQFGLSTYFLKYSREYETQADLMGAQIMARAGYDPRQMANMFKTIESQGGGGGPEFLSSHPNPGNRYNAINKEAQMLNAGGNTGNQAEFQAAKSRLTGMSPALTAEQIAQQNQGRNAPVGTSGRTAVRVEPPASQFRTYTPAQYLQVAVPANWSPRGGSQGGVTYAPEGGYFEGDNGATAFTHGVQLGVAQGGSGDLQRDTEQLLQNFAQGNPQLRRSGGYQRTSVGGKNGLTTQLSNVSEVTGQPEYINISTAYLRDGNMIFVIGVAPQAEANNYANTFAKVRQNMKIQDR
jgi:beta-barrel assembly-enhancing protease